MTWKITHEKDRSQNAGELIPLKRGIHSALPGGATEKKPAECKRGEKTNAEWSQEERAKGVGRGREARKGGGIKEPAELGQREQ